MFAKTPIALMTLTLLAACLAARAYAGGFTDRDSWTTFDAGDAGIGNDPDGYSGAVFDGRFVYFAPLVNGAEYHGEVLRYDTMGSFGVSSSWMTYDPGDNGVGNDPDGYMGAVFDGKYVYFAPSYDGNDAHGEVMRFDTAGVFDIASSWATYDPGAHGVGNDPDGYGGAVFDGRYVYFTPTNNGFLCCHGEVLRYDTEGSFTDATSWTTYDPGANGVGDDADGYHGAVFDGHYVYFVPYSNGTDWHGEVLRYDTLGDFADSSSWITYDPGAHGVGDDPDGYGGAVFDGTHIYFAPYNNGTAYHSEVLQYDTTVSFTSASSWAAYDPRADGVGSDRGGYIGAVFDGQYVYFAPARHGQALRYDTTGNFGVASSWTAYDPGAHGIGDNPVGYIGAVFDGHHIYFAPWYNGADYHGEVLRYETLAGIPAASHWGMVVMALLVLAAGTVVIRRSRTTAP